MITKIKHHEVYAVYNMDGVIIYIGSGANNRHKHCESGCSHVYELNKMHFNGQKVVTKILRINLTKEESIQIEKELILFHKPSLNRQFTNSDVRKLSMNDCKLMKEKLISIVKCLDKRNSVLDRFYDSVLDLLNVYKIQGLSSGVRIKSRLISLYKGRGDSSKRLTYFNSIFEYKDGILKLNEDVVDKLNSTKQDIEQNAKENI